VEQREKGKGLLRPKMCSAHQDRFESVRRIQPSLLAEGQSYNLLNVLHQAGGATIDGASYTYDNAGNRASKTNYLNGITENYTYDTLYQLTQVTQGGGTTESYTYDAVGNRLSSVGVPLYNYNSSNELTSTTLSSYTYDANGNTLTNANASGTTQYAWDGENRLTSVTLPNGGGAISFKYDPFGRRIQKSSAIGTSLYLYDGPNLIEETDGSGAAVARYSQQLSTDDVLAMLRSVATSFYNADGLGSATSISNAAGALTQTYTFNAFGNLTTSSGSLSNPFQYTGREFDSETGLLYLRARYYDPAKGRFISEDPLQFEAGSNFYIYSGENPVGRVDPFGFDWIEYTGQSLTLYGGNFGDRIQELLRCKATSGYPGYQSALLQNQELGPVPEGHYRINLALDPARPPLSVPIGNGQLGLAPGVGVQFITGAFIAPEWGDWRARLQKVKLRHPTSRDNFYLHNSHKGYTHGCVETCDALYDRFVDYHNHGVGSIDVNVRYTTSSTSGGTAH